LNDEQRKLLLAFSVYRKPVQLSAAQAVSDGGGEEPKMQAHSALDALLNQHLPQAWGEGRFQLHTIVANYAQSHFIEGDEQANLLALRTAHAKAAQHYMQYASRVCPPREKRRIGSDVELLVEAVWQLCQAEQWQEAYALMDREGIFTTLKRSGGNAILLELYLLLFPFDKWHPEPSQEARIYHNLGVIYRILGRMERAIEYLEKALQIYKEQGDALGVAMTLNNLGRVYAELGGRERARGDYEEALHIYREQGDSVGEGCSLNNLGWIYISLGKNEHAQKYFEQALSIFKEVGDRRGEAETLNNLGRVYEDLKQQAMHYYQEALNIAQEVEDHEGQGKTLRNLGKLYLDQQRFDISLAFLLLAQSILTEAQSSYCDESQRGIDTLHKAVGDEEYTALLAQVEPQAQQIVEKGLQVGV
jgi:tetratricopeptide (TPR) repeat protein